MFNKFHFLYKYLIGANLLLLLACYWLVANQSSQPKGNKLTFAVSGEVVRSGVFITDKELTLGEAILLAGGFSAEAKIDNLNLAEKISNYQHIIVTANKSISTPGQGIDRDAVSKTNINEATVQELDLLPGIGPALAAKIIDSRPYSSLEDLDKVSGISTNVLSNIQELIEF